MAGLPPPFELAPSPPPGPAPAAAWPVPAPGLRGAARRLALQAAAAPEALSAEWPGGMVEMADLAEAAIRAWLAAHPGPVDAAALARAVTVAQAEACRGRRFTWPGVERVRQMLRDAEIYRAFDGRNIAALARRFRVSDDTIYRAIQRQRKLRRRVRQ